MSWIPSSENISVPPQGWWDAFSTRMQSAPPDKLASLSGLMTGIASSASRDEAAKMDLTPVLKLWNDWTQAQQPRRPVRSARSKASGQPDVMQLLAQLLRG